jgi:hypothetical protein
MPRRHGRKVDICARLHRRHVRHHGRDWETKAGDDRAGAAFFEPAPMQSVGQQSAC